MGFLAPRRLAQKSPKTLDEFEKGGAPDAKRAAEVAWWRAYGEHGITPEQAKRSFAAG